MRPSYTLEIGVPRNWYALYLLIVNAYIIEGEVMSDDNPPMVLPNGQAYSKKVCHNTNFCVANRKTVQEKIALFWSGGISAYLWQALLCALSHLYK